MKSTVALHSPHDQSGVHGCRPAVRIPVRLSRLGRSKGMALRFKPEHAPDQVHSSVVQKFVEQQAWAAEVARLHQEVHELVQQRVEPLKVQPTQFAPNGVLQVPALDGKSEFQVVTHAGEACISHKYTTLGVVSGPGLLYTKTGIHACMEQGTPQLDFEMVGYEKSFLLAWTLTPRLSTLRHPWYTHKYYRSLPPGSRADLVPFTELYTRLQALTRPGDPAAPALLQHFNSPRLWTRLMSGHAAMFTLNPLDSSAMAAVKEHASTMVGLWCALVAADAAGPGLQGEHLVQECRDMSRIMANFLDADEDADTFGPMIGAEGMAKLKATVSGAAAVGRTPWWAD